MKQTDLARLAGMPRPNLSDLERGRREPTLRTLRSLGSALGIRPGILADGVPPPEGPGPRDLTRAGLERSARAVASGKTDADGDLALLSRSRAWAASGRRPKGRVPSGRRAALARIRLEASVGRGAVRSLVERVSEKARP